MSEPEEKQWSEAESARFVAFARLFVPERELLVASIAELLEPPAGSRQVVDLGGGDGTLAREILTVHPELTVHVYDRSSAMLARCQQTLQPFAPRFTTRPFELAEGDWRDELPPLAGVVSSLAVHHLRGLQKAQLFCDLQRALVPGGQLLIADIIEPMNARGRQYAGRRWDDWVARRSREEQRPEALEEFRANGWNYYFADPADAEGDHPSSLADQLTWLTDAGFRAVDVYWLKAGHALFGGVKP